MNTVLAGTVRLFCEGVDLTLLEWRFYHDDDMYISEHFDIDNANETTKCFNDSTLDQVSASVQLINLSRGNIMTFCKFLISSYFRHFSKIHWDTECFQDQLW